MELHAGKPYWLIKNRLFNYFNPLTADIRTEVAVIGSGITGSLVAHKLCREGIECAMFDKRSPCSGSTCASTALLQYEIDVPLSRMKDMVGEENAALAFHSCLEAIDKIDEIFRRIGRDPSFERRPSLWYASDSKDARMLEEEFQIRIKHDLPVEFLDKKELRRRYGIEAPCALTNDASAQIDSYKAAGILLADLLEQDNFALYPHCEITDWKRTRKGYRLKTSEGKTVDCRYLIIAAGFEAGPFMPRQKMKLTSTYAIVSHPVEDKHLWHGRSLIWETASPYIYIRTDDANRIIVGGGDKNFSDPFKRNFLLNEMAKHLEKRFRNMFPKIPFQTEMQWAGTFSETPDGLPLIGETKDRPGMFFALGYGGNGITFSVCAAEMALNKIRGIPDPREYVFGFDRKTLK